MRSRWTRPRAPCAWSARRTSLSRRRSAAAEGSEGPTTKNAGARVGDEQLWSCSSKRAGRSRAQAQASYVAGSPYPSRSPRARPSGWTRTQGLSLRGRARARSGASSTSQRRALARSPQFATVRSDNTPPSLSEFALPARAPRAEMTVIVPRGVKPGGRFAVPLPALAQPTVPIVRRRYPPPRRPSAPDAAPTPRRCGSARRPRHQK